jgi:hypothetical protein
MRIRRFLRNNVLLLVVLLLTSCETVPESSAGTNDPGTQSVEQPTKATTDNLDKKPPSNTRGKDDEGKRSTDLAAWMTVYLDAGKLTEKELAEVIAAQMTVTDREGDPEFKLLKATVMASSNLPADWKKALELLAGLAPGGDNQLMSEWLKQAIKEKQSLNDKLLKRQAEIEALRTAQRIMESKLTELQQKIEALTQIESSLIEKQVETIDP